MSYICYRGHKCMCFQCREKDCEKYQPETPEWFERISRELEESGVAEIIQKMEERNDGKKSNRKITEDTSILS